MDAKRGYRKKLLDYISGVRIKSTEQKKWTSRDSEQNSGLSLNGSIQASKANIRDQGNRKRRKMIKNRCLLESLREGTKRMTMV